MNCLRTFLLFLLLVAGLRPHAVADAVQQTESVVVQKQSPGFEKPAFSLFDKAGLPVLFLQVKAEETVSGMRLSYKKNYRTLFRISGYTSVLSLPCSWEQKLLSKKACKPPAYLLHRRLLI
jgi:hypothetical protein